MTGAIATSGTTHAWSQARLLPLSDGQSWQSPMVPSAIAMADIFRDMLVAPAVFATVPAANTASNTIANMRASLRMALVVVFFLISVQIAWCHSGAKCTEAQLKSHSPIAAEAG
ncbi:hypothetical protein [Mesorhizobium sp. A556]